MNNQTEMQKKILDYWNERAALGDAAGSNDLIAKQLEMMSIANYVKDGMRILEMGCGNGITAILLAESHAIEIVAMDFSEKMIESAKEKLAGKKLKGSVSFHVGDVRSLPSITEKKFDMAYTERVIINLSDWETQEKAISDIGNALVPGGFYVMCENSQDGLDKINAMREGLHLPAITAPWHNRYLHNEELLKNHISHLTLEDVNHFSSTYYFLSRVVNASLATKEGKEPKYDAPINKLALELPSIGDFGQGKIWVWRRK